MFNKSNLFPKSAESFGPRSPSARPVMGVGSSAVSGSGPAAESSSVRESAPAAAPSTAVDAAKPPETLDAAATGGSRLIVGPDVKLKGAEILDCDTLVVEGRVEATMDSRVIRIA